MGGVGSDMAGREGCWRKDMPWGVGEGCGCGEGRSGGSGIAVKGLGYGDGLMCPVLGVNFEIRVCAKRDAQLGYKA